MARRRTRASCSACAFLAILTAAGDGRADGENEEPLCSRDLADEYDPKASFDTGGRLYLSGFNFPTGAHELYGYDRAAEVLPRDSDGIVNMETGLVGFAVVGMSMAHFTWGAYERDVFTSDERRHGLVMVDLAEGGFLLEKWIDPAGHATGYGQIWGADGFVGNRLEVQGVTAEQIQVIWLYHVLNGDEWPGGFNDDQTTFRDALRILIDQELVPRFPNLKMVYLSTRELGFYADEGHYLEEPRSYEIGYGVRALVDGYVQDIDGGAYTGPYVGWGPYWWAKESQNEADPRVCRDLSYGDGFFYECNDFLECGKGGNVHPSTKGQAKLAVLLDDFFSGNAMAAQWYNRQPGDFAPAGHIVLEALDDGLWDFDTGAVNSWAEPQPTLNHLNDAAFITFSISDLAQAPLQGEGQRITHAELSLRAGTAGTLGSMSTGSASVFRTEPWTRADIEGGPASFPADVRGDFAVQRTMFSCKKNGPASYDVTEALQDAVSSGENEFSFRVQIDDEDVLGMFRALEYIDEVSGDVDPPRLIITWRSASAGPGDLNLDGVVDPTDLLILLGDWGKCVDCGECVADIDGDCTVGTPDLLILLGNWG